MKRIFSSTKFLVMCVFSIMVLTTAVSYTYWKSGLDPAEGSNNAGTVVIGQGEAVPTYVTANLASQTPDNLIPSSIDPASGQVHEVTLEYTVIWQWDYSKDTGGYFQNMTSTLRARIVSIYNPSHPEINFATIDNGTHDLFVFNDVVEEIVSNNMGVTDNSVTATFTITMNEPDNKAIYDLVSGKTLRVLIEFSVDQIPGSAVPTNP